MTFDFQSLTPTMEGISNFPEYSFASTPPASATSPGVGSTGVREMIYLTGKPGTNVALTGTVDTLEN